MADTLRYPIGEFTEPAAVEATDIANWIDNIEQLPVDLREVVEPLSDWQLDTPYREGGWTVRQVVHHIGDSHLNSYVRFKWTLTEDRPVIKDYREELWAELPDYVRVPIPVALDFLDSLHARWVVLLRALTLSDLEREFVHPVAGPATLATKVAQYAWHGRHHLAHIESLASREGWSPGT